MSESLADQLAATALFGGNADFIEELYDRFLEDPKSVDPGWSRYFQGLKTGGASEPDHRAIREKLLQRLQRKRAAAANGVTSGAAEAASAKQGAVSRLIQVYANRGHLIAQLDPLGLEQRPRPYVLDLEYFGLSQADLETEFFTGSRTDAIPARSKLKDILAHSQIHLCRHHRR